MSEYETGGFWADDISKRGHCYKIIPKDIAQDSRQMTVHGFERVYQALGKLGYMFRDAGHDSSHIVVSLNKPISQRHLSRLMKTFYIEQGTRAELAFV
ncbi:MAG: hypothetical protein HYW23_00915 [Candidatus Aenigmarchaeota archaeon]|nr:hypothetical protein [Candidatus Aenigmarchaeota archaeon]